MKLTKKQQKLILEYVDLINKNNDAESLWTCNFIKNVIGKEFLKEYIKLFKITNLSGLDHWLHHQLGLIYYQRSSDEQIIYLNNVRIDMLLLFIEIYK